MPSLYAQYIKEREDKDIVETESGFATYRISGSECYIEDIYIVPEKRKFGVASNLANNIVEIAKSRGCKYLTGSVAPLAKGSTDSMKVLLSYGFKLLRSEPQIIYFIKELN